MNLEKLTDCELLALCLMGESRGEPNIGKLAVAHVILNRAAKPGWWGIDVRSVILKPYQFSCFNKMDPNFGQMPHWLESPDDYQGMPECIAIAELAINGFTTDPTGGATHYHEQSITPDWVGELRFICQIGRHRFYS